MGHENRVEYTYWETVPVLYIKATTPVIIRIRPKNMPDNRPVFLVGLGRLCSARSSFRVASICFVN